MQMNLCFFNKNNTVFRHILTIFAFFMVSREKILQKNTDE